MKINFKSLFYPLLGLCFVGSVQSNTETFDDSNLESDVDGTLIITAELDDRNQFDVANSVTIIDAETIEQQNAQHLSDLFSLTPNVNFATGASRGRFIQIRGVGERSEFSEPVNYSVGVVLDGIDFTGISTAATALDLQQVEVLRGPQGTLYGANGLAGLINLVSADPTEDYYANLSTRFETFSGIELSGVVSGILNEETGYRFAVKQYISDGYMDNLFLGRQDTNNIDEFSLRGKLVSQLSDTVELKTTLFVANIDNGYDAFSLDGNRNTLSDQPGFDRQKTNALSFNINWQLNDEYWLETLVSYANSDLDYAYDEDWSFTGICDDTACDSSLFGFDWWYSSFDQYQRNNKNTTLDMKLHSSSNDSDDYSWVTGMYFRDQQVDLTRKYTYVSEDFSSRFSTKNFALYGQVINPLTTKLNLVSGLRFEKRQSDYNDSLAANFKPSENLWGGKLALEYHIEPNSMLYALVSRGFKTGGFNTDESLGTRDRLFDTEFMWNYETGIKGQWLDDTLTMNAAFFYQDRKDIQSKQSIVRSLASGLTVQDGGDCPCSFTDLINNAASGSSYGFELETRYSLSDDITFYSAIGLLSAEFDEFQSFTHVDADNVSIPPIPVDLSGRDVAHAPNYQTLIGAHFYFSDHFSFNPEFESKDSFYFSDRHDLKSGAYETVNLRLVYKRQNWQVSFYVNNLPDRDIKTRGFGSFGNDPRTFYERGEYFQFAAPRVCGISASVEFD